MTTPDRPLYDVHALVSELSADPARDMDCHLLVLYTIARFLPARLAVEIGVDDGSSTLPLLLGVAEAGGILHSVDVAPSVCAHEKVEVSGLADHWKFHQNYSDEFAEVCPRPLDLVLVDGAHGYDSVKRDWEKYEPLVRTGGLLLFHDKLNTMEFPGIARLIDQEIRPHWQKWECLTLPYGWGLTLVRKLGSI